jgi:hypothetical protein
MVMLLIFMKNKRAGRSKASRGPKTKKAAGLSAGGFLLNLNLIFLSGAQADRSYKHKTNNNRNRLQNR